MTNRLAQESSPYLQQHAENPVEWYAWGDEAFQAARAHDKPILLSIGYAACHWCHVMAHESFEDESTARMMNELFVNVKVDREERPDVDSIYMQAVQAISGHGGWPMTVFLTPDGVPFFGGTYFPPEDRHGMPSFKRILVSVSEAWRTRREEVLKGAETLRSIYAAAEETTAAGESLTASEWRTAVSTLSRWYDAKNGGFGNAPKFPQPMLLDALLKHWARSGEQNSLEMVRHSFRQMARGGLYDQLGGGFHRYCVDAVWLVPHFEKMLYDNALLTRLAVHLWQANEDAFARGVAESTIEWAARELQHPRGAWYSSLDADSEGEEGTYYVWSREEFTRVLGAADAELVAEFFGVTDAGNFEGSNVLSVTVRVDDAAVREAVSRALPKLRAARNARVRPGRDEKIIAGWNALMLRAVADASAAFNNDALRQQAVAAAQFLKDELMRDGRVLRTWHDGVATIPGYLEDHAALALAFIATYNTTHNRSWLDGAFALHAKTVELFWDAQAGAWFDTARDAERLVTRPRDVSDNAIPSGTSLAVELDLIVGELRDDGVSRRRAEYVLATLREPMMRSPLAFGHLLSVADLDVNDTIAVAVVGRRDEPHFESLCRTVASTYAPSLVMAFGDGGNAHDIALLRDRSASSGSATAYVCRGYTCDLPTSDPKLVQRQLIAARRPS